MFWWNVTIMQQSIYIWMPYSNGTEPTNQPTNNHNDGCTPDPNTNNNNNNGNDIIDDDDDNDAKSHAILFFSQQSYHHHQWLVFHHASLSFKHLHFNKKFYISLSLCICAFLSFFFWFQMEPILEPPCKPGIFDVITYESCVMCVCLWEKTMLKIDIKCSCVCV